MSVLNSTTMRAPFRSLFGSSFLLRGPVQRGRVSMSSLPYPRAAVAVSVRCSERYLLVRRSKPPNQGMWSLPGGKMELGETALEGGRRELSEEVIFSSGGLRWHPHPFTTSDAIVYEKDDLAFHYLIAQCFAEVEGEGLPEVEPADDAADAKWFTLEELIKQDNDNVSNNVHKVVSRTEELYKSGALPTEVMDDR